MNTQNLFLAMLYQEYLDIRQNMDLINAWDKINNKKGDFEISAV